MEVNGIDHGNVFRIRVREALAPNVLDWFGCIAITPLENGGTLLTGPFLDQSALRGFLTQLWNLNFTVVSVEKVGNGFHRDADQ
jgi:hypothetical protein